MLQLREGWGHVESCCVIDTLPSSWTKLSGFTISLWPSAEELYGRGGYPPLVVFRDRGENMIPVTILDWRVISWLGGCLVTIVGFVSSLVLIICSVIIDYPDEVSWEGSFFKHAKHVNAIKPSSSFISISCLNKIIRAFHIKLSNLYSFFVWRWKPKFIKSFVCKSRKFWFEGKVIKVVIKSWNMFQNNDLSNLWLAFQSRLGNGEHVLAGLVDILFKPGNIINTSCFWCINVCYVNWWSRKNKVCKFIPIICFRECCRCYISKVFVRPPGPPILDRAICFSWVNACVCCSFKITKICIVGNGVSNIK